jgi:hypothetical protein
MIGKMVNEKISLDHTYVMTVPCYIILITASTIKDILSAISRIRPSRSISIDILFAAFAVPGVFYDTNHLIKSGIAKFAANCKGRKLWVSRRKNFNNLEENLAKKRVFFPLCILK